MGRPTKLKIRSCSFNVRYVPKTEFDDEVSGEIIPIEDLIRISSDISDERQTETIIHEVLHGMLVGHGLSDDVEEQLVQTLSESLTQFIRDNPSFIRYALLTLPLHQDI